MNLVVPYSHCAVKANGVLEIQLELFFLLTCKEKRSIKSQSPHHQHWFYNSPWKLCFVISYLYIRVVRSCVVTCMCWTDNRQQDLVVHIWRCVNIIIPLCQPFKMLHSVLTNDLTCYRMVTKWMSLGVKSHDPTNEKQQISENFVSTVMIQ
jgi:hypothetical protein